MLSTDRDAVLAFFEREHSGAPSHLSPPDDDASPEEHTRWDQSLAHHQRRARQSRIDIGMIAYGATGLAFRAGDDAWVQALPVSGGWRVHGRLGSLGDETGRVLAQETLVRLDDDSLCLASTTAGPAERAYLALRAFGYQIATQARYLGLFDSVPALSLQQAGGACPFQAEGTLHGLPFYFRYRSGGASLSIGSPDGPEPYAQPLYAAGCRYGEDMQGFLSDEEFVILMRHLIRRLERSTFAYEFVGTFVQDVKYGGSAGEPSRMWGHGHSQDEAWTSLHTYPEWMEHLTAQDWADHIAAHGLTGQAANTDERVFPQPEPVFAVAQDAALDARAAELLGDEART